MLSHCEQLEHMLNYFDLIYSDSVAQTLHITLHNVALVLLDSETSLLRTSKAFFEMFLVWPPHNQDVINVSLRMSP